MEAVVENSHAAWLRWLSDASAPSFPTSSCPIQVLKSQRCTLLALLDPVLEGFGCAECRHPCCRYSEWFACLWVAPLPCCALPRLKCAKQRQTDLLAICRRGVCEVNAVTCVVRCQHIAAVKHSMHATVQHVHGNMWPLLPHVLYLCFSTACVRAIGNAALSLS